MSGDRLLHVELGNDGIVFVYIDQAGEAVNTLRADAASEFAQVFGRIEAEESVRAVILLSKKRDHFVAGADIGMLDAITDESQGAELSRLGQAATDRIARCKVPVVAAIHGACLGGGLEIALACHARVASSSDKTKLGVPEVQLGILPGMGGTQRLPGVVGVQAALDLLLTGRQLDARRALHMGLLNKVVDASRLTRAAVEMAERLIEAKEGTSTWNHLVASLAPDAVKEALLADNPLGRKLVFDQAEKGVTDKTRGNYPAPISILEVTRLGLEQGLRRGLEAEALAFGALVVTPQARALRHVYFAQQAAKRLDVKKGDEHGPTVERVAIIGGGLMGQGIAKVSLHTAGLAVRLKDTSRGQLKQALLSIDAYASLLMKRQRLSSWQRQQWYSRLTTTTGDEGIAESDFVIEAVFEDLALKREVLASVERRGRKDLIFASNTSAFCIADIARDSQHKERVLGMHYFSPVEKMPLLEVVRTEWTAPAAVQAAVDLGKKQGKTVVVVNDGPGFYTTRILGPYLNEAAHGLVEGYSIEEIDRQLVDLGFPVGPFTLLDEIGIDVGHKVAEVLHRALGERMVPPLPLDVLVQQGRRGRKTARGFYLYSDKSKGKRAVDPAVYAELGLSVPSKERARDSSQKDDVSVGRRCLLAMVNEAARCLDERILASADDGDVAAIFGLGFPAYLGGPFHYIAQQPAELALVLRRLANMFGARFEPAQYIHQRAVAGGAGAACGVAATGAAD